MSEQSKEELAQITKDWDEASARIKAERQAAGLIECPRCEGAGLNDEDIDDRTDCCRMCNGDGYFHAKDLNRKIRAQQRRLAKLQREEEPLIVTEWRRQLN